MKKRDQNKERKQIVCFPIETKVRELDGRLYLAFHLLAQGFDVLIGSRSGILREVKHLKNCFYFAKSISKEQKQLYEEMYQNQNKILYHNIEGGILYKDENSHYLSAYPEDLVKYIDSIYLFGDKIKNGLIKTLSYIDENKLKSIGAPRFDLLKPKYRNYHHERISSHRKNYGNYILINTSFSLANPYVGQDHIKQYIKTYPDFSEEARKQLLYKQEFYGEVLETFIKSIKQLAEKYDQTNFVIRPHPSESLKTYIDSFENYRNVFVNNEGSVHTWIIASTGVIHYDCTTGVESVLANKPTLAFVPQKDEKIFAWLPAYVSKEVNAIPNLLEEVGNIISGTFEHKLSSKKSKVLEGYIANSNSSTHKILVDDINFQAAEMQSSVYFGLFKLNLLRAKSNLRKIKNRINNKDVDISSKKFEGLSGEEVIEKLNRLSKIENLHLNIKVNKLGDNVVYVRSK